MANTVSEAQLQQQLTSQFQTIKNKTSGVFGDVIVQAVEAYKKRWHVSDMPIAKKQMLMQSLDYMHEHPTPGVTKEAILSAAQDIAKVDNPLSFMLSMFSIIIPNFAYTEVVGIQNLPTKTSPIYIPQISATQARNGFEPGDALLGATNWAVADNYTTNQVTVAATAAATTITLAAGPLAGLVPGTVDVSAVGYSVGGIATPLSFHDDGQGGFANDPYLSTTTESTVNYLTGAISITLADGLTAASTLAATVFGTLDPDSIAGNNIIQTYNESTGYEIQPPYNRQNPAQVTLEFNTLPCTAVPYRIRSIFSLDNYYSAKKVLAGYDLDAVISTSMGGLINKEISGNVFTKMLNQSDALYTWNSTPPTGVSWAIHRLSLLELMVEAKNGIRQNIQRCGGNIAVLGTGLINQIETLDSTIYTPQKYSSEPIGPYVHGTFSNGIKVLKNQAPGWDDRGFMCYKSNDLDASVIGGSYIPLYGTPVLAQDSLVATQGMGCQVGFTKVFNNSIVELGITGSWQNAA